MSLKFHRGDLVYYPSHGLARIVAVRKERMDNQTLTLYVLELLGQGCVIKIPAHRALDLGLRPIVNRGQVKKIFQILTTQPQNLRASWGKRLRDNEEKLRKGSPFEMAEILRDLLSIQNRKGKGLSFAERRQLELVKQRLIKELAFAVNEDEERMALRVEELIFSSRPSQDSQRTSRSS